MMRKTTKIIRQSEPTECGLACLCIVANAFGHDIDLASLRERFRPSTRGSTLKDLSDIAADLSLTPKVLRIELEQLDRINVPAVLHWEMNHFVVLTAVKGKKATIIDPSSGRRTVTRADLDRCFTGVAMEFQQVEPSQKHRFSHTSSGLLGAIFSTTATSTFLAVLLFSGVAQMVLLFQPFLIGDFLSRISAGTENPTTYIALGLVLLNGIGLVLAKKARGTVMAAGGSALSAEITGGLIRRLLDIDLSWFSRRATAEVVERITSAAQIHRFLVGDSALALMDGGLVLLCTLLASIVAPSIALIFVLAVAAKICLNMLMSPRLRDLIERQAQLNARQVTTLVDMVRNINTIKITCSERERYQNWYSKFHRVLGSEIAASQAQTNFEMADTVIDVALIATCLAVVWQYSVAFSVMDGVVIVLLYQTVSSSLVRLQRSYLGWLTVQVQWERAKDILLAPRQAAETVTSREVFHADPHPVIAFENVSFRYSSFDRNIIEDFSALIEPNEFLVITGQSGTGKSTLLKLLLRVERPNAGRITIAGVDVGAMSSSLYASYVGAVQQDEPLFLGSIRDNITLFDPTPDYERMQRACKVACIHDDILQMPMKYSTMLASDDPGISGGQRQRVAIARALYRNPKILILDEATSNLDEETESRIFAQLSELELTAVFVTHRTRMLSFADRILRTEKRGVFEVQPS
ncbi:peptidase domain-containing ABC transporter [Rhizobium leguminosarum]|uniref:peptidase domain-containing ABC transporter n=1 Tax=Rhizobium leguminosarum TaxID=384 RepID=UPI0004B8E476|nr:peptidase domain-containing ABC transporter [Rhizobium leguminosarum]